MAVDLIARGLAARARDAAAAGGTASANDGALPLLKRFADLSSRTVPAAIDRFEAGGGPARGCYAADTLATSALAAAHPRFCKADAAGRYFRLLSNAENLIPVACAGAVGSGTTADHSVNDQPAIQAALKYQAAVGADGILFDRPSYSLWRPTRTAASAYTVHDDQSGCMLSSTVSTILRSTCQQTKLYRRHTDGSAMSMAKFQLVGGEVFRGGGIFMVGHSDPAAPPDLGSLTLDNVMLVGGLPYTANHVWPANPTTGDGWDLTDKGIWQDNDHYCGNITLKGRSGVIGFAGELIYSSGVVPSCALRFLTISDESVIGESNGSCLNPNGITLRVGRCLCYDSFLGIEGWTGEVGGYIRARFRNNVGSSLQGGIPFTGTPQVAGSYYNPASPTLGVLPIGSVDIELVNAGTFSFGSWIDARVRATDSTVGIGNSAIFPVSRDTTLELEDWVDQRSKNTAVSILGGAAGSGNLAHVTVKLSMRRTLAATAAGYKANTAVYSYGAIGPDVWVIGQAFDYLPHGSVYAGATYDNRINFRQMPTRLPSSPQYYDLSTAGGTIAYDSFFTTLIGGNAAGYDLVLPTTGAAEGAEWTLYNINNAAGGVARVPLYSGLANTEPLLIPGKTLVKLAFSAGLWQVVLPSQNRPIGLIGPTGVGTGGGAIPAGGLSDPVTIPVPGAVVGMDCSVNAAVDLGDQAQIVGRVSAPNTVRFRVRNLNPAATLTLPATYYRAAAWGGF
ncbi:MAG: hypothetical protein ABW203_00950 [Novosphingobium sp.]